MNKLVLATRNQDKVGEILAICSGMSIEFVPLDRFPDVGNIIEDGDSLEANALKKAREVHRATQLPSLADDSGLEVGYLNGAPGVLSSRYAGPNATYADNCKKLLENLRGVPPRRRGAKFRCVLALVGPDVEEIAEGTCHGAIIEYPRGNHGFGYDPLFVPQGHTRTLAEMESSQKNSLSHRSRAIQNMKDTLDTYFSRK